MRLRSPSASQSPRAEGRPGEISPEDRDRLVRLAYRFLWNVDDAEDAVQEALAFSRRRAGQLREPAKWWPWLCGIVVQQCRLLGRKQLARRRWEREAQGRVVADGQSPRSEALPLSERGQRLRAAILRLPDRQREVTVLRHLHGMSFDDIGEVLRMSPATARVHAHSAREALRAMLLQESPEWFEPDGVAR